MFTLDGDDDGLFRINDKGGKHQDSKNIVVNECVEGDNVEKATNNLYVDAAISLKPDVSVEDVSFPQDLTVKQDQNINYSYMVRNVGEGDAEQFRIAVWLSDDEQWDDSDIVMSGPDDLGSKVQQMAAGASQSFFKSYKIPKDLADGPYWIIVRVDAKDQLNGCEKLVCPPHLPVLTRLERAPERSDL